MSALIDIHTHLQQYESVEISGILSRADAAGVAAIIAAGTTVDDSRKAVELARRHRMVFAGAGIHPSELNSPFADADAVALDNLAGQDGVVVMSEIGIDHMAHSPDHNWQDEAFDEQVKIALRHGLPIVFHARECNDDLSSFTARSCALSILSENDLGKIGGAAHYFQGDWKYARQVLDLNLNISLAKPLLRMSELQEAAQKTPMDRIVLETDSYPQPFKKKRAQWTEPKDTLLVAECLAELKGMNLEETIRLTTDNALLMLEKRSNKIGDLVPR